MHHDSVSEDAVDISIILPAWNESTIITKSLCTILDYDDLSKQRLEIVVVDDGSTDGTASCVESVNDSRVRVIRYEPNRGKGYAVRIGMLSARGCKRVFTDSDIPYRLSDLSSVLEALDIYPVVIGDRTLETSRYRKEIPLLRRIASSVFESITAMFITRDLHDTQCGLKGFREEAAHEIFSRTSFDHFGFDVEVLFIALKRRFRIGRVPVVLERNYHSSVNVFRDSLRMLRGLMLLKYKDYRGDYE